MDHPNIDLIQRLYAAFGSGDLDAVTTAMSPDIRWHNSGTDWTAGTLEGIPAVVGYLTADNHVAESTRDVLDILTSDERVAVVARGRARRGDTWQDLDVVQVLRVEDGRVAEVWNYFWDQNGIAEFMTHPM
jgi:ketosteroid isomerase-like protein